jgi:FkbH-like protein
LHQSILASAKSSTAVKLALIGDCLLTELSSFVIPSAQSCDVSVQVTQFYFSASQSGAFAPDEILRAISDSKFDVIGMSFLTFEGLPPYTALMAQADSLASDEIVRRVDQIVSLIREYINQVRASTDAPIVLHGCCGLPLSKARAALPFLQPISSGRQRVASLFNERLLELAKHMENMVFLNEEAIVSKFGYRAANSRLLPRRSTYRALFHPSTLGKLLYPTYLEVVRTHDRLGKMKVLLVDFDNTLWDGVMAEGDVTHNEQGQQLLKSLKDAGILLVSVSKNDPASIRWNEMRLTPDDFVLNKISWSSKAASIKESAQQLDLGLDSFVFLDDNPAERFMVGKELPEIRALDPADPFTWRALELALALPNTRGTEEARRRTEIYREAADRREALAGPIDYAALMAGLDLRVNFGMVGPDELDRAHELLSRTNQFNTTTLRLTRAELGSILREPDRRAYVATLEDRFGKLGTVGLVLVTIAQSTLIFDDVVMSCRAMGFGLEAVLIRGPFELDRQLQRARGQFIRTERNSPCASLFKDSGFRSDDNGWWTLESEKDLPQIPDWMDVTFR